MSRRFAREAQFDLGGRKLEARQSVDQCDEQGRGACAAYPSPFGGQRHLLCDRAAGPGAIRFEDPRLGLMMAAPPKKENARPENQTFVDVAPKPGMLLLWESWLRHGVEPNARQAPAHFDQLQLRLAGLPRTSPPCYCDRITMGGRS